MISYIKGIIEEVEEDKVIIDNNGMGYGIFMPQSSLELIGPGEELKIYTYLNVKEDAMQLYGFLSKEELNLFKKLIGVSGVGPKGGLSIITACPGDSLQMAIISGDAKAISKAQGIGAKTAQRIIIELKDKIDLEEVIFTNSGEAVADTGVKSDAIEALIALGYSRTSAFNAVNKVDKITDDVEELLKLALKNII
ncbi:Holliday junction branch migration protein RuvA [uncultured Eubacterium sp.]|uniref:Holliday junction branch migration protein RuvA n=1 Tax=Eubacterium sp. TaxID=142586 RepID=UPI0026718C5F|nr:Holliday junction branch migration protein RuvA [uncultured Eubacterium sp.]